MRLLRLDFSHGADQGGHSSEATGPSAIGSKGSDELIGMPKKLTTIEFAERAARVHGGKYDYSATNYSDSRTKVSILCPVHGIFQQSPSSHLRGNGCWQCGRDATGLKLTGQRNLSTADFIVKAIERHGERYDYSATRYLSAKAKVQILCPLHGSFEQSPDSHLRGCGCPDCANDSRSSKRRLDTATFIQYSKLKHGELYDYSQAQYVVAIQPVTIICREHGPFDMLPYAHYWNGSGCPECSKLRVADSQRWTTEEFLEQATIVHGDRYSYEKVDYVNSVTDVTIICPRHGEFQQRPANHIHGKNGCPWCAKTLLVATDEEMRSLPGCIYVLRIASEKDAETFIKVGITQTSVDVRFRNRQYDHLEIEPIRVLHTTLYEAWNLENLIHSSLSDYQFIPETWFGGATECYSEKALPLILTMLETETQGKG